MNIFIFADWIFLLASITAGVSLLVLIFMFGMLMRSHRSQQHKALAQRKRKQRKPRKGKPQNLESSDVSEDLSSSGYAIGLLANGATPLPSVIKPYLPRGYAERGPSDFSLPARQPLYPHELLQRSTERRLDPASLFPSLQHLSSLVEHLESSCPAMETEMEIDTFSASTSNPFGVRIPGIPDRYQTLAIMDWLSDGRLDGHIKF